MQISAKRRSSYLLVPACIAGALLLLGCSDEGAVAKASTPAAQEQLSEAEVPFSRTDRLEGSSAELKALMTELSAELDGAGDDVTGVGIGTFGTTVNIDAHIASAADGKNIAPESLRSILTSIASRSYPAAEVEAFEINVWGDDGTAGDTAAAAAEIGVKDAYIDHEWQRVEFPATATDALFN